VCVLWSEGRKFGARFLSYNGSQLGYSVEKVYVLSDSGRGCDARHLHHNYHCGGEIGSTCLVKG